MRAAWLTDIHLDFLSPVQMGQFGAKLRAAPADVFLISGDIGTAPRLVWYLQRLRQHVQRPIYFVLGNHDYYGASFASVEGEVSRMCSDTPNLVWLTQAGIIELTPGIACIGHDSWADGRCGDYDHSEVLLNDYLVIADLAGLNKAERLLKLNALGDEAAAYMDLWLPRALEQYPHVVVVTHVPPFREACWHEGRISDDDFLPHYTCRAFGEALVRHMTSHPDRHMTVLCGHTHGAGQAQIRANLRVLTGAAEYGQPGIQRIFEF